MVLPVGDTRQEFWTWRLGALVVGIGVAVGAAWLLSIGPVYFPLAFGVAIRLWKWYRLDPFRPASAQ